MRNAPVGSVISRFSSSCASPFLSAGSRPCGITRRLAPFVGGALLGRDLPLGRDLALTFAIRAWKKWQGAAITKVLSVRRTRKVPLDAPYAMVYVSVASSLGGDFVRFAEHLGPGAESYFVRTLQYAALNGALCGEVRVPREAFGPVVLTRSWDIVSAELGARVYDAFLASGLGDAVLPHGVPLGIGPTVEPVSPHDAAQVSTQEPTQETPHKTAPVATRVVPPVVTPVAQSSCLVLSGQVSNPLPPNLRVSPQDALRVAPQVNGHSRAAPTQAQAPAPPTAADRAALRAILTALSACAQNSPATREQLAWATKRRELDDGRMPDAEIRLHLRDHESRYQRTASEARLSVSRNARQERRERHSDDEGGPGEGSE